MKHNWLYHSFVYDFGPYGVHTRECQDCGLKQESDSQTGHWPDYREPTKRDRKPRWDAPPDRPCTDDDSLVS